MVSESTASNTELGEFFVLTEPPGRELSEFLSASDLRERKQTHRVFGRTHRDCPKLSKYSQVGSRAHQKHPRAFIRTLAKFGEPCEPATPCSQEPSLTFTRVPAKVPYSHQSSGEGAFCMWEAFRTCPILLGTFKRAVTERRVFAFACQYSDSPRGRTGNHTVTPT